MKACLRLLQASLLVIGAHQHSDGMMPEHETFNSAATLVWFGQDLRIADEPALAAAAARGPAWPWIAGTGQIADALDFQAAGGAR